MTTRPRFKNREQFADSSPVKTRFAIAALSALLSLPLPSFAADELPPPPKVRPLAGASVIVGQIDARSDCDKGEFEAWLSQDSLLLYQVDVVARGSFEFHVLPGRYNLVVTSSTGCFSETRIEAAADNSQLVTVRPIPAVRPERHAGFLDWLIPPAYGFYYSDCPTCNMMAYYQMQPSFMPQLPWTAYYGSMAYPNFGFPGPWSGIAMNGGFYPGWGNVGMGKPLLYLEGEDGTPVSIKVKLAPGANWLVAAPAYGDGAWSGKLQGNHLMAGGAEYRDLFYDYRAESGKLQDTRGFCTDRDGLMPALKGALRDSGFKEGEIHDFEQYWSVKMPLSKRYCVFPQGTAELGQLARVEIDPKPQTWTQLTFVIQVEEALSGGTGRFSHPPVESWKPEPGTGARVPATAAQPGAQPAPQPLKAREWGVGFFMTTPSRSR
jgi:hypothetical protein